MELAGWMTMTESSGIRQHLYSILRAVDGHWPIGRRKSLIVAYTHVLCGKTLL